MLISTSSVLVDDFWLDQPLYQPPVATKWKSFFPEFVKNINQENEYIPRNKYAWILQCKQITLHGRTKLSDLAPEYRRWHRPIARLAVNQWGIMSQLQPLAAYQILSNQNTPKQKYITQLPTIFKINRHVIKILSRSYQLQQLHLKANSIIIW